MKTPRRPTVRQSLGNLTDTDLAKRGLLRRSVPPVNDQTHPATTIAAQVSAKRVARPRKLRAPVRSEHAEALYLMQRVTYAMKQWPELKWFHAIPNGGKRSKAAAGKLKAEGVKPGVPDYCLPVRRGNCPGLVIELKAEGGRPTNEQLDWLEHYVIQGWHARVCAGWETAWAVVEEYLERKV